MSKRTVALLATVAFAIGAVPAAAETGNHTEPGTPEAKNCSGQTVAYLSQLGAEGGVHGLAGLADAFGFTTKQVHTLIGAFCVAS